MTTVERSYILFIVGRAGEELLGTWTMYWPSVGPDISCIYKFLVNGSHVHVQIMDCDIKNAVIYKSLTQIKDSIIIESQDDHDFPSAGGWRKAPRIHNDGYYLYFKKINEQLLIGMICVQKKGWGWRCDRGTGSKSELLL